MCSQLAPNTFCKSSWAKLGNPNDCEMRFTRVKRLNLFSFKEETSRRKQRLFQGLFYKPFKSNDRSPRPQNKEGSIPLSTTHCLLSSVSPSLNKPFIMNRSSCMEQDELFKRFSKVSVFDSGPFKQSPLNIRHKDPSVKLGVFFFFLRFVLSFAFS